MRLCEYKWDGKMKQGYFHQWANEAASNELYIVGIVEDEEGRINTPVSSTIRFLEPAKEA